LSAKLGPDALAWLIADYGISLVGKVSITAPSQRQLPVNGDNNATFFIAVNEPPLFQFNDTICWNLLWENITEIQIVEESPITPIEFVTHYTRPLKSLPMTTYS